MTKRKNPIDRFIYGVRDGFKNIKKAFAESEVIHKCIVKFLPANTYSKEITTCAAEIASLLETQDVVSVDKEFNTFFRVIKDIQPNIKNADVMVPYLTEVMYKSYVSVYPKITREQFDNKEMELLQKPDCDLNKKEEKIMKEVLEKIMKLRNSIKPE